MITLPCSVQGHFVVIMCTYLKWRALGKQLALSKRGWNYGTLAQHMARLCESGVSKCMYIYFDCYRAMHLYILTHTGIISINKCQCNTFIHIE